MGSTIADRVMRAKELLAGIHHVPIATVNDDGSPHNSPVFMAFDDQLNAYWSSSPEGQHSRNIARDGQVFLVVFDSRDGHGGLYIKAKATALENKTDVKRALAILEPLKETFYGTMGDASHYIGDGPQRLYCAVPQQVWVNRGERNEHGLIIRDTRHEITLSDILPL
jgi:general stress protein 26